ncbi:MAG: hypothetical protein D4R44_04065 [Actinobacteria bacterium]|nr:MAG: hypothetical protein D4R44_04065 [Actinomycetota bacterium]
MLKFMRPKTPVSAESVKEASPDALSSTGIATPAGKAPISSNNDHLISALNSLRALLTPSDQAIQDSLASGMPVVNPALSLTDEEQLLASIFPSLDGRVWERNRERALGRGETLRQQCEEAIQFYFDNYVGYS